MKSRNKDSLTSENHVTTIFYDNGLTKGSSTTIGMFDMTKMLV